MDRRQFLQTSLAGLGTLYIPSWAMAAPNRRVADEHFFLQILVQGGMDPLYLFDSRSLALTAAGKQAHYHNVEPYLWQGTNGQSTLASDLVRPLEAYKDRFSILNGVMMATTFDGHDQNMNFYLAGNAFGGECFLPHLNGGEQSKPLDGLISGFILAELQNLGKTVPLGVDSAANLIPRLKQLPSLDLKDPVLAQLKGRMEANGQGLGRFAKGSSDMAEAFSQMPELASALAKVDTSAANKEGLTDEEKFLHLAAGIFRSGVAKTAILVLSTDQAVDTHDEGGAKASPALAQAVVGKLDKIFKAMGDIEFGPGQSLWDVTTLMFGSEFGRTMRQSGKPIDNTGTDHNPLNNSFLIGGKGVKSNLVIGASDFKTADEELSGAHLSKDKESMKTVGRPFDFQTQSSREDKPAEFKADDYLNVASVVNTIYHLYGVSSEHYRSLSRNGSSAPILTALLK